MASRLHAGPFMTRRIRKKSGVRLLALTGLLALATHGCASLRRPLPPVDRSQDERIRADVEQRLLAEPDLDADGLRVEVDGGIVRLHGSVRGIAAWQCAIRNAEMVRGVRSVVEFLVLERGPREIRCLAPASEPGAALPPAD